MYIFVILYCLGNEGKKKSLYMFNTDANIVGISTQQQQYNIKIFSTFTWQNLWMQELTVQVILLDKYSLNKILSICKTQRVSTGSETHVFHFIVDFFLLFMSGITLQNMVKIWLALTCHFDILLYLQYFKCLLKNLSCLKLKFSKTYTNIHVYIYMYIWV